MTEDKRRGQKLFFATALEKELLFRVQNADGISEDALLSAFPNRIAAHKALEGCLAKRFLAHDEQGRFFLTKDGEKQL
ncbi:MAG: hypothetical protein NC041_08445 [Bacteroides sp.]|nr:hypothetical protein [Prevotella sp.]MCM1408288.1 hypothetical protein [Treponema brennaborense]MCM1470480.1 hypothetical protein [Bacteroides sp.]